MHREWPVVRALRGLLRARLHAASSARSCSISESDSSIPLPDRRLTPDIDAGKTDSDGIVASGGSWKEPFLLPLHASEPDSASVFVCAITRRRFAAPLGSMEPFRPLTSSGPFLVLLRKSRTSSEPFL